jgi:hypothetical protein
MNLARALAALSLLPLAIHAQSSGDVPAPVRDRLVTGGAELREPFVPDGSGVLAGPGVVTRPKLEGDEALAFGEVPGGIVLGLAARPATGTLEARSLRAAEGGALSLELADGRRLALPEAEPSLVLACLRFATEGAGHWLIDLGAGGEVLLARELVDTRAGIVAVRSDLGPLYFMPSGVGVKSTLVDRDVRLVAGAADGAAASLRFETDLELRFYRPSRRDGETTAGLGGDAERVLTAVFRHAGPADVEHRLAAPPELERPGRLLAGHLGELADLAGWVAFFRWAAANEVAGLPELRAGLESLPADRVSTPRRLREEDRTAWIRGTGVAPDAGIPDWMREHARKHGDTRRAPRD